MQNFRNLGASGGGGDHFLTKPSKGTSLPHFTRFEPLSVQIGSGVFSERSLYVIGRPSVVCLSVVCL